MRRFHFIALVVLVFSIQAFATVTVSTPTNNATVASPVQYLATATAPSCAKGVASMGIYVNNKLVYTVSGAKLSKLLTLASGAQHTVVEEWDKCGTASYTTINLKVASPTVTTVNIGASPSSIAPGSSSTLTVTSANATAVTLTAAGGVVIPLSAATGGTAIVSPTATTIYTATATGTSGTATATATVTVTAPAAPTVNIVANPTSVVLGASATLTVTTTNATAVTLIDSVGNAIPLTTATGGTAVVSPTVPTTYIATATGTGTGASTTATATLVLNVTAPPAATVTIKASPSSITVGKSSTLTVVATNATLVTILGSDQTTYTLGATGGTVAVSPATTTTYTVTATSTAGNANANATVTVVPAQTSMPINHVIFLQQENHSFDNYFGMLNPYRKTNGWNIGDDGMEYDVDGIDDKLSKITNSSDEGVKYPLFKFASTCTDDNSSDWLASFGDVNRWNRGATRPIIMDGFVHDGEGYAKSCAASGSCSGAFTDVSGLRAMGYYDEGFLNYYYWLASEFAVSDRWFSPMASKSVNNRIATFSGGTTQGLVRDPGGDDHLPALTIPTIFQALDKAKVSWRIYFTVSQGFCLNEDECTGSNGKSPYPATYFSNFTYSYQYLHSNPTGTCTAPTQPSSVVGDSTNSFCVDPTHIAPLSSYYTDLINGTLPSFAFIEAGYANNDEHPGSGQSVLAGQAQVAKVVNALMTSSSWNDSVFFLTYDEGGGPYDHVPPVPGHSNDLTSASLGTIPDIAPIAVNPDSYLPCVPAGGVPTTHCDLTATEQGSQPGDVSGTQGFAAQLGFRVPNAIISPFTRRHFVSHTPIDHTAIIKFVENRFIGPTAHLTARDAAQPDLMEFFDFTNVPWEAPPTPPAPVTKETLGHNPCTAAVM